MGATVDGGRTKRAVLTALRVGDQKWIVVNDANGTALCVGWKVSYGYRFYEPVHWTSFDGAERWIKEGTIAELQESFTNLDVGFREGLVQTPEWRRRDLCGNG